MIAEDERNIRSDRTVEIVAYSYYDTTQNGSRLEGWKYMFDKWHDIVDGRHWKCV